MNTVNRQLGLYKGGFGRHVLLPLKSLLVVLYTLLGSSLAVANINLQNVEFSSQPGGRFEVRLDFDAPPPEPKGYNIEKPARIALDLVGVSSQLKQKKFPLSYGNASSAVILESGGRTRIILNLVELASYKTRIEGNSLFVEVGDAGVRDYLKPTRDNPALASVSKADKPAKNEIVDLDFKRGDQGEGRLVINLANPKASINVFVEGSVIKVNFDNIALPERLQRRYDVSDFATPVQSIEVQSSEGGALFSLKAAGDYDYLAYQTDNEYVVSVKPLTSEEREAKKKEFAYVGEKLSLNFQDIEVRAVLQLIADFTSLNLVASDTVDGRITLRLQNVPWDQALDLVLKTKGLGKRQIGNVLMVAPADEIAERERQEIENNKQIQELAPLQTEYLRIRYADAKELYNLFNASSGGTNSGASTASLLSARGSVIVDERTNSLLVTETAQKLEEFRRVVRLLDVPVRQVLVEARIVIANSSFDKELGVEWGAAGINAVNSGEDLLFFGGNTNSVINSINSVAQATLDIANGDDLSEPILIPEALNVDLGVANPTGSLAIGFVNKDVQLQMELNALESQGRGEIVSQPKVITGDKQEAEIKSGSEVPYQESSANGETTISFKEAVLKLKVKPSITPDDRIIMELEINQDSVGDLVPSGNGGVVPTIDTTALTTKVLVGNGETVVLGGVFRTVDVTSESKVPFLGDIPYLGRLFSSTSITQEKTETLIFITPRILADTLID
ncbi:MAG: type IV pilus secretin PilQ family protein [Pseudomonadales bacterium]